MRLAQGWGRCLLRSTPLHALSCWVIHLYIRVVYATNRWTVEGGEVPRRLRADNRGFILAFWHGRLLMIPMAWQRLAPMHMLISAHRDGRIIADAVSYFGVVSVPGSSRRGGSAALRTMLKRLEAGDCVGITPDGPSGPAMEASSGIVNLARLSGAPIVPIVFATSRRRVLPSWDRFHLALPFGRGAFLWGNPIEIARELDADGLEEARRLIETRMNELAREADCRVGQGPSAEDSPSPAPRERKEPTPRAWEGEDPRLPGPSPGRGHAGQARGLRLTSPAATLSRGAGEGPRRGGRDER